MAGAMRGGLRRALRRFTLGSGPLKRRSDRVQVLGRVLLALSLLAAAPLAVVAVGITRGQLESTVAAQSAHRHPARAVVEDQPEPAADDPADANVSISRAAIVWPGPGGVVRHGTAQVPTGTTAGTTIPVWVDRSGALTTAPLDQATIGTTSIAAGMLATVVVPVVAWGMYCLLCTVLDAQRRRRWEREWDRVEREWGTRLS
jgi:hypothetical protein